MSETRFAALETQLAYQDDSLRALDAVVTRQQAQIDRLESLCRRLAERIPAPDDGAARGSLFDELPPHY